MTASALASEVVSVLRRKGFKAWLVGGCVRDLLLGRTPKDYDVATDARPDQVVAIWPNAIRVGVHFGVVLIRKDGAEVEVATFRSEGPYRDGRHPATVHFETDPRQDVRRRDFTINALLLDPETNHVLDYVGGRDDLRGKVIRAIGDPEQRFREDHLRMLRAIRFAARFRFDIDPETEGAIVRLHPLIRDVSAERAREEIVKILTEGQARRGFELLERTHLLQMLMPEVARMKGVEQPPEFHPEGDVWTHTLLMLEQLPAGVSPTLAMGVLLHDVGKPGTFRVADRIRFDGHVELGVELARQIMSRLRFSNEDIRLVEELVDNHMRFKDAPNMKESTLKRFLRLPHFDDHLELHRLDCLSSHRMLDNYEYVRRKRGEFGQEAIRPPRLITGNDLINAGLTPGPDFGRILQAVEDAQLDGRLQTREEALAFALAQR